MNYWLKLSVLHRLSERCQNGQTGDMCRDKRFHVLYLFELHLPLQNRINLLMSFITTRKPLSKSIIVDITTCCQSELYDFKVVVL